jgi:hypothetical protein
MIKIAFICLSLMTAVVGGMGCVAMADQPSQTAHYAW